MLRQQDRITYLFPSTRKVIYMSLFTCTVQQSYFTGKSAVLDIKLNSEDKLFIESVCVGLSEVAKQLIIARPANAD